MPLWFILLVLVYFKGAYHWGAGVFCGLMLLLHNNFGIIYSAAYMQLLLTLGIIDAAGVPGRTVRTASAALTVFLKRNFRNLALILACTLVHYLIFRNPSVPNDYNYVRLGIGFLRILTDSFYWYVVVVSGLSFVLLLRLRPAVSGNYLAAGLCLIYLAIGNSLYFFGRSHENNIINISVILVVLFFLLLDLAGLTLLDRSDKPIKSMIHKNLAIIISLVFIASITIWYGDSITKKVAIQAKNAGKGQLIYPSNVPIQNLQYVITEVKTATGGSPKIYFISSNTLFLMDYFDFLFDYYGGYTPVVYYNPMPTWISRSEFNKFLQGLVDQGYYLVVDDRLAKMVLSSVSISNSTHIQGFWVAWKR